MSSALRNLLTFVLNLRSATSFFKGLCRRLPTRIVELIDAKGDRLPARGHARRQKGRQLEEAPRRQQAKGLPVQARMVDRGEEEGLGTVSAPGFDPNGGT